MEKETADKLADELRQVNDVRSAEPVYFTERGGVTYDPPEEHGTPEDDLYGVSFYAYDALIPKGVIDVVAEYDTGGIYIHPDPGVITPQQE